MQCNKSNAINAMQEKEYDKCNAFSANYTNAISAMTQMQCDEVNAINAI